MTTGENRSKQIVERVRCSGCHSCYSACPKGCIEMKPDEEGFLYPVFDVVKCVQCGRCEAVCPVRNGVQKGKKPLAFACVSQDGALREKSSSGGLFSHLARHTLQQGGVVFGVALDENHMPGHRPAETEADAECFRGSKYVQSSVGESFKEVRSLLDGGRRVLFTGTPCQVAGLRTFLGKRYDGLICADIICHGVPSPKVWQCYVESLAKEKTIRAIRFRDKSSGWRTQALRIQYADGTSTVRPSSGDPFLTGFLKDLYLRPSCHRCSFKSAERASDITMADLWGAEKIRPQMDDNRGVSLALIHTDAGFRLLESVRGLMNVEPVSLGDALAYNSSAILPASEHPRRSGFFHEFRKGECDFHELVFRCCRENLMQKVLRKVRQRIKYTLKRS